MKQWIWTSLTIAILAAGAGVLTPGTHAITFLAGPRDEAAAAGYALSRQTPADYEAAINTALADHDEDLAASLVTLAEARGVALPAATRTKVAAAEAAAFSRLGADAWNGFLTGEAPNEAALAGAVAGDLTGLGDVRDLYRQAGRFVRGEEVDPLLAGLSAIGLGATVATYASAGTALPARAGLSTLKAVKRAGKLSPRLAGELGALAASALQKRAIKGLATSLEAVGTDIATIGSKAGYRATVTALGTAQSASDLSVMARLSARFGKATRGVLALAGGALVAASVVTSATVWAASLLIWLAAAGLAVTRLAWRAGRWLGSQPAADAARRDSDSQTSMASASATMGNMA
jgi:hypothetical protein